MTVLPDDGGRLLALWLDGRNYAATGAFASGDAASDAMQLHTTILDADGSLSDSTLLDARTCTCCQTSAVVTDSGKVLVVYRDRSEDEIRDISILRMVDGVWSQPVSVSRDGWQIEGRPVNGPAIDSKGRRAVVAWFTAADNLPKVKLAFSDDEGESFGAVTATPCCPDDCVPKPDCGPVCMAVMQCRAAAAAMASEIGVGQNAESHGAVTFALADAASDYSVIRAGLRRPPRL